MQSRSNRVLKIIATLFVYIQAMGLGYSANAVDQFLAVLAGEHENLDQVCTVETMSKVADSNRLDELTKAFNLLTESNKFHAVEAALMKVTDQMWQSGKKSQVSKLDAALIARCDSFASFRTGYPIMAARRLAYTGNKKALLRLAETYYLYPHQNRKLKGDVTQYLSYTLRTIYIPRIRSGDRSARYEIIYLLKHQQILEPFEKAAAERWNKEKDDYKTLTVWIYIRILLGTDDVLLWGKYEQSLAKRLLKHEPSQGRTRYVGYSSFARLMLLHGIYSKSFMARASVYFEGIKPAPEVGMDQSNHFIDMGLLLANLEVDQGNHQAVSKIMLELLDSFAQLKYRRSVMERMPLVVRALRNDDQAKLLRKFLTHYEKFLGEGSTDKGYDKVAAYHDVFTWLSITEFFRHPKSIKREIFSTADSALEVLLTPKTGDPSLNARAFKNHARFLLVNGMWGKVEALIKRVDLLYRHVPNQDVRRAVADIKMWLTSTSEVSPPLVWRTSKANRLGVSSCYMSINNKDGNWFIFDKPIPDGTWTIYTELNGWLKPHGMATVIDDQHVSIPNVRDAESLGNIKLALIEKQRGMLLGRDVPRASSANLIRQWTEYTSDGWLACGVTSLEQTNGTMRIQRSGLPTGGYTFNFESNLFQISQIKKYHLSGGIQAFGRGAIEVIWCDNKGTELARRVMIDTGGENPLRQQFSIQLNNEEVRSQHEIPGGATHAKLCIKAGVAIGIEINDLLFHECGSASSKRTNENTADDGSLQKWIETKDSIQAMAVSEDGKSIIVAQKNQTALVVYDLDTKKELKRYQLNKGESAIWVSCISQDTWGALIKGVDRKAGVFLLAHGGNPPRRVPTGLNKDYTRANLSRNGSHIAWTSREANKLSVSVASTVGDWTPRSYTFPKINSISAMKFTDDNRFLIVREGTQRHVIRLDAMLPERVDKDLLVFTWYKTELREFRSIPEVRSYSGILPFRQTALAADFEHFITWGDVSGISQISIRDLKTGKAVDSLKLEYIRHLIITPTTHDLLIEQGKGVIFRIPKEVWLKK